MIFIHAPNHILKFAILRRQPSNDLVRSARRVNRQFRMKKYCLADLKLVLVHRISPPSRRRVYHVRGLNDSPRTAHWVVTAESGSDGELFVIDAYALSPFGIATWRHPEFREAIEAIVEWKTTVALPRSILAVRPDHLDRRIALQQSYFTFHVPNNKVLSPAAVLKNFTMCGLKKGRSEKSCLC